MTSQGRRAALLVLTASVVAVLLTIPLQTSEAPSVEQDILEEYGYADIIITEGSRSSVYVAYKVESGNSPQGFYWNVTTVSKGTNASLMRLSEVADDLVVVMTGGSLGNLTLIQTDVIDDVVPVDVRFEMYGGSLSDLRVLTVPYSLDSQLENSYTLMFGPLASIELDLESGSIGDLVPTEDMVSVDSMTVEIGEGMSIDRMLTSGSNGRYGSVSVDLGGGSVGYMTNEKSVVGNLEYDFRSGSVDYFCIGADTENGSNSSLSNLNTFYVQGDVRASVHPSVEIRQAIIGAGVLDIPSRLWNGDLATASASRNVEIDADSMPLSPDTCFLTSNRVQSNVFQFSNYTIGGTPRTKSMSTDYYASGSSIRKPIYGDGGIWNSATDTTVSMGYYLYVNADLSVSSGSQFTVSKGARLVTAGHIDLAGMMVNEGEILNSGIIEKREGGKISGNDPLGDGFIAYCINVTPTDGRIDVMASDDDTVVLRTDDTVYISHISVLLENGDRVVTVTAPDTLYMGGDEFLIGLRDATQESSAGSYELDIMGIGDEVLSSVDIEVTVPCTIDPDIRCYVYHIDDLTGESRVMEVLDRSYGEITFVAEDSGTYVISTTSPEGIDESVVDVLSENSLNIALAVIIVIVGAVVVYILLKRD